MLIYQVKYDATNFLEKNRDTLSPDIIHVLRSSGKKYFIVLAELLKFCPASSSFNVTWHLYSLFGLGNVRWFV